MTNFAQSDARRKALRALILTLVAFAAAASLHSCATYRMQDTGGGSISLAGDKPSVRTIKVLQKPLPYSLRIEEFTDERPPEEMKRSERAKKAAADKLDFYSYGEQYAAFQQDLVDLTAKYFGSAVAFQSISSGMIALPSDLVLKGRVKNYYGYYENATSAIGDAFLGDIGRGIVGASKEMPTGGSINIEVQLVNPKTGNVVYEDVIRAEAPQKDTFAPRDRNFAAFEYADSRLYQIAVSDFLQRLSAASISLK
jgi:hypothetical protein